MSMIVGTAGHIDHGKTALITALTGAQTDTLKDEQSRGITIALGYAYQPLATGEVLGFVDVPGHENLIHTMVAGASGIDYALLIVAADDGVMPQTHEHMAILSLLGIKEGGVVITKQDRASAEQLAQVKTDIQALVAPTFLAQAPVFVVDSLSGQGITELSTYLHAQAQHQREHRTAPSESLFRLAIDRVFTLAGQGTVVTGTVHSGQLLLEQQAAADIRLMPANEPVRIRSIHAQNQPSVTASQGQRCALNIAAMAKERIHRGDWIADARCFTPSQRLDVRLQLLDSAQSILKTWSPVHVHIGAAHYVAHAVPLSQDVLRAGQSALVQLVFDEPVCAMPADRFIVRDAQAKHTLGGGQVLDANAPDRKRRSLPRLAWLDGVEAYLDGKGLEPLLRQAPYGLETVFLQRLTQRSGDLSSLPIPEASQWVQQVLIHTNAWEQLLARIESVLAEAHERYPDEPGIEAARLRRMVAPRCSESLWLAALDALVQRQRLALNGAWYHLSAHTVSLSAEEEQLAHKVIGLSYSGEFNPPWVRDMATTLEVPEEALRQLGRKLVRQGLLYQVVRDLYYHRDHVMTMAQQVAQLAAPNGFKAAELRDQLGLGRKRTIQILEFFERIGYTRRLRDKHIVRTDNTVFTF